ncbi:HEAT repeat domain-containing protein [Streptomyces sp. NBC_01520]|uniref:HEAT repeat domain-containing protein n=1 Tax=Streptomyces sp. NBC_01520 TaxID=2903892 RepID=UPI00386740A9
MTPEQEDLILSLVTYPGRDPEGTPEQVLRHFNAKDGHTLGLDLLRDALHQRDSVAVEMALIVGFTFGITSDYLEELVELCSADWHHKHEDVVSAIGKLHTPDAVDALYQATQWVPGYLEFDDSRALATKAVWALGKTPGPEAQQALVRLLTSGDEIVRSAAMEQIARRKE